MGSIKRVCCAVFAVAASTAVFASPAQAGLLGSVGTVVKTTTTNVSTTTTGIVGQVLPPPVTQAVNVIPAGYDPLTPIEQLLAGQAGLGTVLEGALCKPVSEVAELAALAGLNPIGDGLTSLSCNASILEYRFFTRFRRGDGSNLERTHVATLGVPTLLNVDEDSSYDLIGTINVTGANTVGLTIDRVPGETATLPVSVEAILRDSDGGLLGKEHLAFGYDARADRAPGRFVLATPIQTILQPSPDFQLTVSQTDRGERIALIGGIFDGTILARVNPAEIRIDYSKSPDTATLRARVGENVSATLTTNRPGPATISGRIVDVNDEDRFSASLEDLPSSLTLTADTTGALAVTYAASARVAKIRGSLERLNNAGLTPTVLQKAVLALDDVPTGMTVSQNGDGGAVATTGGPIGRTKVGIANGEPKFLTGEPAYVNVDDDGTLSSVAVELPGLERATFSLGDAVSVGAKLAATPLYARLVEPGRSIDARVNQLPSEFDLGFDPAGGSLSYDGRGTGIGQITLAVDSNTPLFSRATKLRGTITDIPALLEATLQTGDGSGGIVVDGSGPIGGIELVASNGPETLPAGTGMGAIYRDLTGGDFLISARILGLRELTFATSPATSLTAHTAGGPFSLDVQTDDLDIDGNVQDLPAKATFGLDQAAGKLTFSGRNADDSPQGIDLLALTASSPTALFGRADRLDARIEDLPADLELTLASEADQVGVEASEPIGLIEVVAANRAIDRSADLPAGTEQGVRYVDTTGEFVVGARVRELKKVVASLGGDALDLHTETAGGPFGVRFINDELDALARIQDLPAVLDAVVNLADGVVTIDGHGSGIDLITLDVNGSSPLFGEATDLKGRIAGIPSQLSLTLSQSGGGVDFTASEPIGSIELAAADRDIPDLDAELPVGGEQGAKFIDTSAEYVLSARVRQLKRIAATLGDTVSVTTEIEPGPFGIRYITDDLNALARIADIPAQLTATIDLANGKVTTNGSAPIELLTFDAVGTSPVFGEATNIAARIEGIPQSLMLDLAQTGTGARLSASEPIRSVKVVAANGPVDIDADVPANQGVTFIDEGGVFKLAAKVEELRLLDAALGDDIRIEAKTKGGPFDALVRTDDLDADAAIRDLPQDVLIALDAGAGRLSYAGKDGDGNPKGIDSITASVRGTAAFFDRARRFDLEILKLAPTVTVDLAQDGSGASIQTDEPIESIAFAASDDPNRTLADALAIIGDPQGAVFRDTPSEFLLAGRVLDLQELTFALSGETVNLVSKLRSTPFKVDLRTDDLDAQARIVDLPARTELGIDLTQGTFSYKGFDSSDNPVGVDSITFTAESDTPLFGRARVLKGELLAVPAEINVGFETSSGGASVSIPNGNLGSLALLVSDGQNTLLPTTQSVLYHDNTNEFRIAAKVLGLKELTASFQDALGLVIKRTAGSRFTADIDVADALAATADIQDLPASAEFGLDLEGTSTTNPNALTFKGRDENGQPVGIAVLDIDASAAEPIFGAGRFIQGHIEQLPSDVQIGFSQTNGKASVRSTAPDNPDVQGPPVGRIELGASDTAGQFEYPAGGAQGAVMKTKTGEPFRIGVRILSLERLEVDFLDTIDLSTKTAGGLFLADVETDGFEAEATIDQLPTQLDLGLDLDGGQVTYQGSSPINRISAAIHSATPVFLGATDFTADLLSVPTQFTLGLPQDGELSSLSLTTTGAPIGQIDVTAHSPNRPAPTLAAGVAGAKFDSTGGELGLALRVFQLEELTVSLDPLALHARMAAGHKFVVDAKLPNETTGTTAAQAEIDQLPSDVTLSLADIPGSTEANPLGSRLALVGNARIDLVKLATQGIELLDGADKIDAQIEDLPEKLQLDLPEPGTGPLAQITARNAADAITDIGQIRLAAGSGTVTAPADTYNLATRIATGNDQLQFSQAGAFSAGVRLSAVKTLTLNLNPINLALTQDAPRTRPIAINATLPNTSGPNALVTALLNKPAASSSMTVTQGAGQPTRLIFDNSANMTRLDLNAQNLGSAPLVDAHLDNLSRKMSICLDAGGLCRRPNPNALSGGTGGGMNRPYAAQTSVDLDDQGTQLAGQQTTLNADIKTSPTAETIEIDDLRFRNISFDLGQGGTFSGPAGQTFPRLYLFIDSRNQDYVINRIRYPPTVQEFRIGTDGNQGRASNRIVWLKGGNFFSLDTASAGTHHCGNRKVLSVSTPLGNINVLNFLGFQLIPVCSSGG